MAARRGWRSSSAKACPCSASDLGKAKVVGEVAAAAVRAPHLVVAAARGRLTIDSDEAGTRLAVILGTATKPGAGEQRELRAGDRLHVDASGHVVAVEAPAPAAAPAEAPAVSADMRWASAMRALDAGDRAQAEAELPAPAPLQPGAHGAPVTGSSYKTIWTYSQIPVKWTSSR